MVVDKVIGIVKSERGREFLRFCIVGTIAAAIDLGVFNLVKFIADYQVSVVCGFVVSWVANYILSTYWTFREKPNAKNFTGVLVSHLINLFVVRMGLMYLFVDVLAINERIAYVPTLIIAAVTSFIMVRLSYVVGRKK